MSVRGVSLLPLENAFHLPSVNLLENEWIR